MSRAHPCVANGWYGGARTAEEFGERPRAAVAMGYLLSSSIRLAPRGKC